MPGTGEKASDAVGTARRIVAREARSEIESRRERSMLPKAGTEFEQFTDGHALVTKGNVPLQSFGK